MRYRPEAVSAAILSVAGGTGQLRARARMQVVYTPAHLAHDITTETFMGVSIPANEVAERAERIRDALAADGGFAVRRPDRTRRGADHRRPRPGARPVPRGGLVRGAPPGHRPAVPVGRHVPEPLDVRGDVGRRRRGARARTGACRRSGGLLGPRFGRAARRRDVRRGARGRGRRADRRGPRAWPATTAAYGLCRPPGHHAARSMYGGYCFFNNAAIAAEAIVRATGEPVAILDVDYHHGNGSQQIFWRRGDVRYVSIHADPDGDYPYFLGRADETGEGDGEGENLNIPLPPGTTNDAYLEAVDRALEAIDATRGLGRRRLARLRHLRPRPDRRRSPSRPASITRSAAGRPRSGDGWSSSRRAATTGRRSARTRGRGSGASTGARSIRCPRRVRRARRGRRIWRDRDERSTQARLAAAVLELDRAGRRPRRRRRAVRSPPLWDRGPGFPTLLHIILEQQVSLASAQAAFDRLRATRRSADARGASSRLTDEELLAIGFSRQKARYGRALARPSTTARSTSRAWSASTTTRSTPRSRHCPASARGPRRSTC